MKHVNQDERPVSKGELKKQAKLQKKEAASKKQKAAAQEKFLSKTILNELPIRFYRDYEGAGSGLGYFELSNQTYMDIMRVEAPSYIACKKEEWDEMVMNSMDFYRKCHIQIKPILLFLPINIQSHLDYFQSLLEHTDNPLYAQALEEKIQQLEYMNSGCRELHSFVMLFSDVLKTLFDTENLMACSPIKAVGMTLDEKVHFIRQLNNPTTKF